MAPVLFLDCDGVLNSEQYYLANRDKFTEFNLDPKAVACIREVLAKSGAKVVLSSTWRHFPDAVLHLEKVGIPIWDHTPRTGGTGERGDDIRSWLDEHPEITRFAIVDDDEDAGSQPELAARFVRTSWESGLGPDDGLRLVALLTQDA